MNKIQTLLLLTFFLIFPKFINAQFKNSIGIHILPWVKSETNSATGIYLDFDRKLNPKWYLNFGYGMLYDNYWQSDEFDLSKHPNIMPIEINIYNIPDPQRFVIPQSSILNDIKNSGISNYKIHDSHRIDHFLNFNIGYEILSNKKHKLSSSTGLILGMADRTFSVKSDSLYLAAGVFDQHPFIPIDLNFWVVFQIRSRYMYLGYNYKINYDYYFNDKISLGLSLASNVSLRKNFRKEQDFYFLGVSSKVYF